MGIAHLLKSAGLVSSTSEAFRMIKQGAVKIDGQRVEDRALQMDAGTTNIYQVGKRKFARVSLDLTTAAACARTGWTVVWQRGAV